MSEINHEELALSRLATQYRESTNLKNYIRVLLKEAQELETVFCSLLNDRWLDTATNKTLDILGEIVGQSRVFIDAEIFDYFGFSPNPQAASFGDVNDAGVGGRFRDGLEPTTGFRQLTDEEYRTFIRARITRNNTKSTINDIVNQIAYIFNTDLVILNEFATNYSISIGKQLTLNEKAILLQTNIIPKTAGVGASYVSTFDAENAFGFLGVPGSKGFGDVNDPTVGGKFASVI